MKGIKFPKRWQCLSCNKKYVRLNAWIVKHQDKHKKESGKIPKFKELTNQEWG